MNVYPSPVDKISLLSPNSIRDSTDRSKLNTFRSDTNGQISSSSTSQRDFDLHDTIHYLSPASTRAHSECEGDYLYQQFVEFRPEVLPPPPADYESTTSSTISCVEPELQRTLAIVKPEAMKYKDVVLRAVNESGLKVLNQRLLHLSPEQISEIYAQHYGSPAFPHMVVSMSISPLLVMSLAGINAVEKWKTMIGPFGSLREEWFFPYSVRTRFGLQSDQADALHGSENINEANNETRYFFPRSILEPLTIEEEKTTDYINHHIKPTLLDGLTHLLRMKPLDPVLYLAEWLLLNNPFQPKFSERVALNPL